MKGLKTITLGVAIAAAPWVAHSSGFEQLDDAAMGEITGQAGVTIELETRINIDQIAYSQGGSGSVLVNNIEVGGFGGPVGDNLDFRIEIDLDQNGDALVRFSPMDFSPVDVGVSVGSVGLTGDAGSATLITDFDMRMWVSEFDLYARVQDLQGNTGTTGSIDIDAKFAIENLDVDFDVAAVSLEGFRMGGVGSLSTLQDEPAYPNTNSVRLALEPVVMNLSLGAGPSLADPARETLRVDIHNFATDIWMPTINVGSGDSSGAASIGSVAIRNLDISGTQLGIYGRD